MNFHRETPSRLHPGDTLLLGRRQIRTTVVYTHQHDTYVWLVGITPGFAGHGQLLIETSRYVLTHCPHDYPPAA